MLSNARVGVGVCKDLDKRGEGCKLRLECLISPETIGSTKGSEECDVGKGDLGAAQELAASSL